MAARERDGRADEWSAAGLRLEVDGELAVVTLANPARRNAQTPATWRALTTIGSALPGAVRVLVLRAEGPSFSAGLDRALLARPTPDQPPAAGTLAELAGRPAAEVEAVIAEHQRAFAWQRRSDLVSVAAVRGHAIGAGLQLALACDLMVLADDALLCVREPSLGLVPDLGGVGPLVEAVGYPRALEMCATGRQVGAAEALRIGLAVQVVPAAELDQAALALAAAVMATPRDALIEVKSLLRQAAGERREATLAAARAAGARLIVDLAG